MSGVLIAPMPLLPIYKGIAGASLLAEILLQKYEYHMPYYRQIKQFSHPGMKGLTESTVDGWFKQATGLLRPLYEVLTILPRTRYALSRWAGRTISSAATTTLPGTWQSSARCWQRAGTTTSIQETI